ncbi:MAG: hypothetical protein PF689_02575 [Deltaproteobacteria bacterium]|jgi:hypothetical protein|nr:hypothetical protein [Deltaproteobacteria bacterium]
MTIIDIYSKRQKRRRGELPDVYNYDEIPSKLKNQIIYIWKEIIGDPLENNSQRLDIETNYKAIVNILKKEYGVEILNGHKGGGASLNKSYRELEDNLKNEVEVEKNLDVIELVFQYIDGSLQNSGLINSKVVGNAIEELNIRFRENGVGYKYEGGKIVRVDSELIHQEAVKPALKLLHQPGYEGAENEFLKAHAHYRKRNNAEALNECLKAFESTMKIICEQKGWGESKNYNEVKNFNAKKLINTCFENELIPKFWQSKFNNLRSLLESSIPTARNKLSGHGAGTEAKEIPDYLVSYILHMTASTIVFLIKAAEFSP